MSYFPFLGLYLALLSSGLFLLIGLGFFDLVLIVKYQRRFPEFDRKIIGVYARGTTIREILGDIEGIYGAEASSSSISAITVAVLEEVTAWQNRPLDLCYPFNGKTAPHAVF